MLSSCSFIRTSLALLALGTLPLSAEEQAVPAAGGPVVSITDLNPVKLERDSRSKLLVAQCAVNGVPCNLIVDTAASHTTFDIKFIKKNFPGLPLEDVQIAPGSNVRAAPGYLPCGLSPWEGFILKISSALPWILLPFKRICR